MTELLEAECSERLFPRIPDEITLKLIAPKLSWRDFHILSSASRAWCHAIRSREVYSARVRSPSTETLVLVRDDGKVGIYSTRDNSCHDLPPIPLLREGIPSGSESVFLDGKLYVIGGERRTRTKEGRWGKVICNRVYELDLVGQRQWKECASMKAPRVDFGCGIKDGKIYVFGGGGLSRPICGSEVYDPKANVWSPISDMAYARYGHRVEIVGEEFFVYDGRYVQVYGHGDDFDEVQARPALELYNPVTDVWRAVHQDRKLETNSGRAFWQSFDLIENSQTAFWASFWQSLPEGYRNRYISLIHL